MMIDSTGDYFLGVSVPPICKGKPHVQPSDVSEDTPYYTAGSIFKELLPFLRNRGLALPITPELCRYELSALLLVCSALERISGGEVAKNQPIA
jgi:hypothetical protein